MSMARIEIRSIFVNSTAIPNLGENVYISIDIIIYNLYINQLKYNPIDISVGSINRNRDAYPLRPPLSVNSIDVLDNYIDIVMYGS